jgi:hypothetical protein
VDANQFVNQRNLWLLATFWYTSFHSGLGQYHSPPRRVITQSGEDLHLADSCWRVITCRQKGDAKPREHLPADKQYLLLQGGEPSPYQDGSPLQWGASMACI